MRERRFKRSRNPRKVFLVICEGETEKEYVEALKRHYRLPVAVKTKVSGANVNARMIDQYIRELGLDKNDDYQVFYLYDADVKAVVNRLFTLPGTVLLTNPCIELWFLIHHASAGRSYSSDQIFRVLKNIDPVWNNYAKGSLTSGQISILLANFPAARQRAMLLDWPENPSSNLYVLVDALEKEKNR